MRRSASAARFPHWCAHSCRSLTAPRGRAFPRISSPRALISCLRVRWSWRALPSAVRTTSCWRGATEEAYMRPLEAQARTAALPPVQVIAVTGGKGGTGKSSVAINLATALAQMGRKTLLLDGDLGLANCDVLL